MGTYPPCSCCSLVGIGFFNMLLMWIVAGGHFPIALLFTDLCRELNAFVDQVAGQISPEVRQGLFFGPAWFPSKHVAWGQV